MLFQHTGRLAIASAAAVVAGTAIVAATGARATTGAAADHLLLSRVTVTAEATAVTLTRLTGAGTGDGTAIELPVTVSGVDKPFTIEGDSAGVGALARSADGRYVTLAGYAAEPGTATTSVPRVVARVDAAGAVDTSTTLGTSFMQEEVRGAVTADGARFWVTGHGATAAPNGGLVQATLGASSGTVLAGGTGALNDTRTVQLAGGSLWFGSEKEPAGLYEYTAGVVTQPVALGSGGSGPIAFVLLDRDAAVAGVDTLYLLREADAVHKYSSDGTNWTERGTISGTSAWTGLTGVVDGTGARLYGIDGAGAGNTLVQVTDSAEFSSPPSASARTTVATAPGGVAFRGVALAPGDPSPSSPASAPVSY
ncbi:hypothetical protein Acy02nite_15450 [Actinoplanes cyaneus]|uniref:Uncharacterized protein n=1 Tax=Actinoplanes cyaneus TaxID=52696 RepID=A0A919M5S2_9ACTN|nr:hypothetical protein [Actinoplanes cyaneus]MCW2142178.1 hypothetical protein [Actinoplanes cyaneus]GID63664.1 hypothetical protein Acy02nite_15450 [Actinoplanes cyaneus]